MLHFESGEGCGFQQCDLEDVEHFHCKDEGCETVFKSDEGVKDHGRNHFLQDQITDAFFIKGDADDDEEDDDEDDGENSAKMPTDCPENCQHKSLHYHCKWVSLTA